MDRYASLEAYGACEEEMRSPEISIPHPEGVSCRGALLRPTVQGRGPLGENSFSLGTVSWRFSVIFFLTLRNLAKLQGCLS